MKWIIAAAAALCAGVATGKDNNQQQEGKNGDEPEAYTVLSLKGACEYLLSQAVACEPEIRLKYKKELSAQERKQLSALLSDYRLIHGAKASTDASAGDDETVSVIEPNYKSCVRMLKAYRDPDSIELTVMERAALDKAVELLRELEVEDMKTFEEKAHAIHDWLVANCSYDLAGKGSSANRSNPDVYNAYDGKFMLLNKKGVCDSYAQAYWLLLQMAGVPCSMMAGTILENGEGHAWNLVYLDDHWAHVDVTFDDPVPDVPDRVSDEYFDKTDKEMMKSREWEMELFPNSEFTELFSSDNELMAFDSVREFISFVREQDLDTDQEFAIEVAELQTRRDFDEAVQEAAKRAKLNNKISSTQDPLFPRAIRVKFHADSEMKQH